MITRSIAAQNEKKENPRYALIYDTETTGILPRELPALGRMTEDDLRTLLVRRLSAQTDILLFSCDQNTILSLLCCPCLRANGQ
jgi:hypothetical protein